MVSKGFTAAFVSVLFFGAFLITGCGEKNKAGSVGGANNGGNIVDNGSGNGGNETTSSEPLEKGKMADIVKKLEQEGKYPVLDRSDTLLGKDEDKNGIRDDIDKYIDNIPNTTTEQKGALKQNAYVYNFVLSPEFDVKKKEDITKYMDMYDISLNCLKKYFDNFTLRYAHADVLLAYTFNTKKRLEIYMQSNKTANGMTFTFNTKGGCDERFFKK